VESKRCDLTEIYNDASQAVTLSDKCNMDRKQKLRTTDTESGPQRMRKT